MEGNKFVINCGKALCASLSLSSLDKCPWVH